MGCFAWGPITTDVMFSEKIKSGWGVRSKMNTKFTVGLFITMCLKDSNVNWPRPSIWSFKSNLVSTAIFT